MKTDVGSDGLETVRRFVQAINRHDVGDIGQLLALDHRFTDSLGNEVAGRENVAVAWRGYFEMVPGYRIDAQREIVSGGVVVLFGWASGALAVRGAVIPDSEWATPVCVRARVVADLIAEWQVYADNEPIRAILRRCSGV